MKQFSLKAVTTISSSIPPEIFLYGLCRLATNCCWIVPQSVARVCFKAQIASARREEKLAARLGFLQLSRKISTCSMKSYPPLSVSLPPSHSLSLTLWLYGFAFKQCFQHLAATCEFIDSDIFWY